MSTNDRHPISSAEKRIRATIAKRLKRQDPEYRARQRQLDAARRREKRRDLAVRQREGAMTKQRSIAKHSDWMELKTWFDSECKKGPTHVCACCENTFFDSGVSTTPQAVLDKKSISPSFLSRVVGKYEGPLMLCAVCKSDIYKSTSPRLCVRNGLQFKCLPPCLENLTDAELRMVSPILPFVTIKPLLREATVGNKESRVNVPSTNSQQVTSIPRDPNNINTVSLSLRRHAMGDFESFRPDKVWKAAKYLVSQNAFSESSILLSGSWKQKHRRAEEYLPVDQSCNLTDNDLVTIPLPQDDSWDESVPDQACQLPAGETLILNHNNTVAWKNCHSVERLEELAFPLLFAGQKRCVGQNITFHALAKSELRRKDRRCALCMPNIFFKLEQATRQSLAQSVSMACLDQQAFSPSESYTNSVLRHQRSGPVYWEARKKELMAMLRQFGPPTFFYTCSAAEHRWSELLIILNETIHNKTVSLDDVNRLTLEEKVSLINRDPVTTARYFDRKMQLLFQVFKRRGGPFESYELADHYVRVEFQQKGSPHIHCLLWLNGAPAYIKSCAVSKKACIDFIDRFIVCKVDEPQSGLQIHKHTVTCKREYKKVAKCRFGMPLPLMRSTTILEPILNIDDTDKHQLQILLERIKGYIDEIDKSNIAVTFDEFLQNMSIDESQYLRALRSGLRYPKVYLKRTCFELRVTNFNLKILSLCNSSMDIQFVLNPYAAVQYILKYVVPSHTRMSELLNEASKEIQAGNYSMRQKLSKLADTFINVQEVSSQEAVFLLLSIPLSRCSRSSVFINTNPPATRFRLTRPVNNMQQEAHCSSGLFVPGIIQHYTQRPRCLEQICLADFAANYMFKQLASEVEADNRHDDVYAANDNDTAEAAEEQPDSRNFVLRDQSGCVTKRKRSSIIRWCNFDKTKNALNFYREQVMLFVPWRNETSDLNLDTIEATYLGHESSIQQSRKPFVAGLIENQLLQALQDDRSLVQEETGDAETELGEVDVYRATREQGTLNSRRSRNQETVVQREEIVSNVMSDNDYAGLIRSLNRKQRKYFYHVMHCLEDQRAFYHFLTGGAGSGKSRLIQALFEGGRRKLLTTGNHDRDCHQHIVLAAATGKAAFNINGSTLHSMLSLPLSQGARRMALLTTHRCKQLGHQLRDLKVLIIDEISLVGSRMFHQIDQRLQQIFASGESFGGKSIICVGDFNQLKPVADVYTFQPDPSNPYAQLTGDPIWSLFKIFTLTEIMRQKNDTKFAIALNNMALGTMTRKDIKMIQQRQITSANVPSDSYLRVFRSNKDVDEYNRQSLEKLSGETIVSEAHDRCPSTEKTPSSDQRHGNTEIANVCGLPDRLELKVGGQYMLTANVDATDGLVNGAIGTLMQVECKPQRPNQPHRVWLNFEDTRIGAKVRHALRSVIGFLDDHPIHWTPVSRYNRSAIIGRNQTVRVTRTQIPVVVAHAITIYKSQGSTYQNIVVTLTPGITRNEMYVACSRVTTCKGLFIEGDFQSPAPPDENDVVGAEMNRMNVWSSLMSQ